MAGPLVTTFHEMGITVVSSWIFNCYVVHDGGAGRPFVVDVGMSRNGDEAVRAIRGPGGIRENPDEAPWVVAATHTHSDHVAGVPHLAGRASIELHLPAIVEDWREGDKPPTPGLRAAARIRPVLGDQPFDLAALKGFLGEAKSAGYGARPYHMPVEPAGFLGDGDVVPGAPDWVVLHTPGHTTDSTSFWCESTRTLLSGDTVLSVGGKAWFNPELVDEATSAATEDRLRGYAVDLLLPGHGRPVRGDSLMGDAIGHCERPQGDHGGLRRFLRRHRGAAR
jgi:glyoxylase-like metal-dependent hydrolase (beta-lactamase superfamily II)